MGYFLSGDIGGSKTLLRLSRAGGGTAPVLQKRYPSAAYAGLDEILAEFLHEAHAHEVAAACLALAGPVASRRVVLTNLPWEVDADALSERFAIPQLTLINDFTAVGLGIAALPPADLLTLQAGEAQPYDVRLVLGAGTGLGVAWLTPAHGSYIVHASEGGHMDFAPTDEVQYDLLRYLQGRHGHVSYERIVSGPGLVAIHDFLRHSGRAQPTVQLLAAMEAGDAAAALSQAAASGEDDSARQTLQLFFAIYGAFAGNLALASLPRGGVYVAGGIAARIARQLQQGPFLRSFLDKGRFAALLQTLPVHVVLNAEAGLLGAEACARKLIEQRGGE